MAPQPQPSPSPPRKPRLKNAAGSPRSGRGVAAKKREERDTPELKSARFSHIIPNGGLKVGAGDRQRRGEPPLKLPAVAGASPRDADDGAAAAEAAAVAAAVAAAAGSGGEEEEEEEEFESFGGGNLATEVEAPPVRRVTGELLAPWQVRLRRKRLAEVAAAARAEEGAESAAAVAAREAQRRWVPASAVRALPDPRLEARVSASDRAPKATVVDTLVLQEGVLGAAALNGESNAMRGLKAGNVKRAQRRSARARADDQREVQRESQEAALSRLTQRKAY
jgi:hypothetical protein